MANRHRSILFHLAFVIAGINCYRDTADSKPTLYPAKNTNASDDAAALRAAINSRDERAIENILTKRVSFQRFEIARVYEEIYEKNLANESKRVLGRKGADYDKILDALMTPWGDYHAEVLHEAIFSRDISRSEDIPEILCSKTDAEVYAVINAYEKKYGKFLMDDLTGYIELLIYIACVHSRVGNADVNEQQAVSDAEELFSSGGERGSYAFSSLVISHRHPQQLYRTFLEYKEISGQDFKDAHANELQDDSLMDYFSRKIVSYITSEVDYFVGRLHACVELDPYTVARIIIWRSEIDLYDIEKAYEKRYNCTLKSRIKYISSKYRNLLNALLSSSDPDASTIQG